MINLQDFWKAIINRKRINEDGCWIYTGNIHYATGYGRIQIHGERISVHRLSCAIHHGLNLENKAQFACHKCNDRRCFNPKHLYKGTGQSNQEDVWNGKCKNGHDLRIHGRFNWTIGTRSCKICDNARHRLNYHAKKAILSGSESEERVAI